MSRHWRAVVSIERQSRALKGSREHWKAVAASKGSRGIFLTAVSDREFPDKEKIASDLDFLLAEDRMCSFEFPYCKRIASHGNCLSRFHRDAADKFPDVTLLDLFSDYKKCVVPIWAYRKRIWEFMILHDSLWLFLPVLSAIKKAWTHSQSGFRHKKTSF